MVRAVAWWWKVFQEQLLVSGNLPAAKVLLSKGCPLRVYAQNHILLSVFDF
jgi:hypothetical protein